MKRLTARLGAVVTTAAVSLAAFASASASADVPSFGRCPDTPATNLFYCFVAQSTDGSIAANGHRLPLTGAHIKIEGGIDSSFAFVPPFTGAALTASPVDVPGGLFGTGLPYNLNSVKATIEQAGPITYNAFSYDVTAPIRIHFTNSLLGSSCYIGSTGSPITLNLTTGTTSPPPPNTPIAGNPGAISSPPGTFFAITGTVEVDNAFAVPAATGCGIVAQAQVTKTINKNLGLPSAAGRNDATLSVDHYFQ